MAAAACKVILCGDPPRAAALSLFQFARLVEDGKIAETPAIAALLGQAADELGKATKAFDFCFDALMAEAFPTA
jgi:hypothetical protein